MEHVLGSLATVQEMADASQPNMPPQQLRVLMQFAHNESLLAALGASKEVRLLHRTRSWHNPVNAGMLLFQPCAHT